MATGLSNIVRMGALVGDPVRATMLGILMDGSEHAAGELAVRAGASPQAASAHLGLLVEGGLLSVTARGRYRYYRLRDSDVAHAIETLSVAANVARCDTQRCEPALKRARRCYDHLAGTLGVSICDSLIIAGRVVAGSDGFAISAAGYDWLAQIDLSPPCTSRRTLVRPCLDWTERRPHIAGWLGAALCERLVSSGSLIGRSLDRALTLTPKGRRLLAEYFGPGFQPGS